MRYKVGIWGQFGDGGLIADGQAVRTTIITNELERKFGEDQVYRVNTNNWKSRPFRLLWNSMKLFFKSSNVVILPADNGFKAIVPIYTTLNKVFKRNLLYIVIGGFLPKLLESHPRFVKMLRSFTAMYVQTESIKKDLEGLGLDNIKYITNLKRIEPVSLEDIKKDDSERVTLVVLSRITQDKGIIDAIDAINIANNQIGKRCIKLDIYGMVSESFKSEFNTALDRNRDIVCYKGVVQYDKTVEVLKPYFAMLFATYFHGEGFPGCFIDAFHAGLPIIATDWLYNKDLIVEEYNGLLVPIRDPKALSEAILRLYYDRELVYRIAKNNLEKSKEYEPDQVLEQFYADLK